MEELQQTTIRHGLAIIYIRVLGFVLDFMLERECLLKPWTGGRMRGSRPSSGWKQRTVSMLCAYLSLSGSSNVEHACEIVDFSSIFPVWLIVQPYGN